jgi:hypothetical protein
MASVALGRKYGIAKGKKTELISVKTQGLDATDFCAGLSLIRASIISQDKEKRKRIVVVTAYGIPAGDPNDATMFEQAYRPILDLGVPVVVASGKSNHPEDINWLPQTLYDEANLPLINVGSSDKNGKRVVASPGSPGGPKLAVHAPGQDVTFVNKAGHETTGSGTSLGKSNVHWQGTTATLLISTKVVY